MISTLYEPFRHWSENGSVYILSDTHFDDDEVIETYEIPIEEVKNMILDGRIKDAKTIVAFTYYLMKYKK